MGSPPKKIIKGERKMRRLVQMIMSGAIVIALLAGSFDFTCLAAETGDMEVVEEAPDVLDAKVIDMEGSAMPYTSLGQCIISISGHDDGMYIDITTGASGKASVIGVKDVKIQKKVWYGWSTVGTSEGGEIYDRTMMAVCITYTKAVKGETYRVTCVHYADVDGYLEGTNDTGAFVYTY